MRFFRAFEKTLVTEVNPRFFLPDLSSCNRLDELVVRRVEHFLRICVKFLHILLNELAKVVLD